MPERVRYFERQRLRSSDLAADQTYHLESLQRHNLIRHGTGVVQGLKLEQAGNELTLSPGFAIDESGRQLTVEKLLHLDRALRLCLDRLFGVDQEPPDDTTISIWLQYGEKPLPPSNRARTVCGGRFTNRFRPSPNVAFRVEPDQPSPVFGDAVAVGGLKWTGGNRELADTITVKRPGLKAASIVDPQRQVEVLLGSPDPAFPERFSILLTESGQRNQVFSIARDGLARMRSASMSPLNEDTCPNISLSPPAEDDETPVATPCDPAPRSRVTCPPFSALEFQQPGPPEPTEAGGFRLYRSDSLRLDLGVKGDKGDITERLEVGFSESDTDPFIDALSIGADGSLEIQFDLEVKGTYFPGPVTADPADIVFKMLLLAAQAYAKLGGGLPTTDVTLACDIDGKVIPKSTQFTFTITVTRVQGTQKLSFVVAVIDEGQGGIPQTQELDNVDLASPAQVPFLNSGVSRLGTHELMVRAGGETLLIDWSASDKFEFEVDEALALTVNFPDKVPPNTGWTYDVSAKNDSSVDMRWSKLTIIEGQTSTDLPGLPVEIDYDNEHELTDLQHGPVSADFDVQFIAEYTMDSGSMIFKQATDPMRIEVDSHIVFDFEDSLSEAANDELEYEITIKNVTTENLKISAAQHRIGPGGFAQPTGIVNRTVNAGQTKTFTLEVDTPATAGTATLELKLEYKLGGFTWIHDPFTTSVNVT